jgi:hypothetical protein
MPAEVDGTAVAALGALLTVLTFSSGFVSVRLHGAYREALAERRQLEAKLVELASSSGPFPATAVELHHEDIRRSLKDQLAIPVVVFLVLFTVLGVAPAVFSGERAGLRWLDSRAPERFHALALLAAALVAVTMLTFLDYMLLRRLLRRALRASSVHKLLEVERLAWRVMRHKRRAWSSGGSKRCWRSHRPIATTVGDVSTGRRRQRLRISAGSSERSTACAIEPSGPSGGNAAEEEGAVICCHSAGELRRSSLRSRASRG